VDRRKLDLRNEELSDVSRSPTEIKDIMLRIMQLEQVLQELDTKIVVVSGGKVGN
jgi:hypothetical protein